MPARRLSRTIAVALLTLLVFAVLSSAQTPANTPDRVYLSQWTIQTSGRVSAGGDVISTPKFTPSEWLRANGPSTVVAAQVENKIYPDPYYGMNMRSIPGTSYDWGKIFNKLPMPDDSPYARPWWYRTQFTVPATYKGRQIALHFDGINYRANIWLNGKKIADSKDVAGAYRTYEFPITEALVDGTNVLALEIFSPTDKELAINWVDWNPAPPDKNMGIWRPVWLSASGSVLIRDPYVASKIDTATLKSAELTVSAELRNATTQPVEGELAGTVGTLTFSQKVSLGPNESKLVTFTPEQYSQLKIADPKLWWPYQMGEPNMHTLKLAFNVGGQTTDQQTTSFGIREVTSEFTDKGHRLYKINGKPILIRGGGWAPDMLLRSSRERLEQELRLTKHMGLNTIRLEGKLETDEFYDMADRTGMLLMNGWCCCDVWEWWKDWVPGTINVATESLKSQVLRMRNHPSIYTWYNGSDGPPPAEVEKAYLDVMKQLNWNVPAVSSATARKAEFSGPSGVKMSGPYDYVPPEYWLTDTKLGGGYGYNTETGPGPAIPPVESLKKFIPKSSLWPVDQMWNYHAGLGKFTQINLFTKGLTDRYGEAPNLEEFVTKSQAMTYDNERAMFEAYTRNKYTSTGVIQWMLNNSWPSIIWHLYDYYLMPAGGYFGAKKANEPLHAMYSHDDRSIAVVNSTYQPVNGLKLTARVLDFDLKERFTKTVPVDLAPDAVVKPITIPEIASLSTTCFVKLTLQNAAGKTVSDNFYWLSTRPIQLDYKNSTFYHTPVVQDADLTMLNKLPKVDLATTVWFERKGSEHVARVRVKNPSKSLAFMARLRLLKGKGGDDVLPIFWDDNYVSLLPGEEREITGTVAVKDLGAVVPVVQVEGWNIVTKTVNSGAPASKQTVQ